MLPRVYFLLTVWTALHHNNCMYLAHHLITVDKMFIRRKHSSADKTVSAAGESKGQSSHPINRCEAADVDAATGTAAACDIGRLRDLVSSVRRLGNDYFTRHINWHKRQLCDLLSPAKGSNTASNSLFSSRRKAQSLLWWCLWLLQCLQFIMAFLEFLTWRRSVKSQRFPS